MSRSLGTKATQGINGDATNLGRWLDASASTDATGGVRYAPCPYEHHRRTDWVTPTSQVTCGICHPPGMEYEGITRRGESTFDELALAAAGRILPRRRPAGAPDLEASAQAELDADVELTVDERELVASRLPNAARTLGTFDVITHKLVTDDLDQALDAALKVDP